jgi:hypothetical protein
VKIVKGNREIENKKTPQRILSPRGNEKATRDTQRRMLDLAHPRIAASSISHFV